MLSMQNITKMFKEETPESIFQELVVCIENNQIKKFEKNLKKLLKIEPELINEIDSEEEGLLQKSVIRNNFALSQMLLDNGANPNITNVEEENPLFYIVKQNNLNLFKLFLNYDVNLNHKDIYGNTLLHYSIKNMNTSISNLLVSKNVYQNINNKSGNFALHEIANLKIPEEKKETFLNFLKNLNIDFNILNKDRNSLLHLLVYKKDYMKIKEILKISALKINSLNFENETPVFSAIKLGFPETVLSAFFEREDIDISYKNNDNNTALFLLIDNYKESFIINSLEKVQVKNVNNICLRNETEFSLAAQKGYFDLVKNMVIHSNVIFQQKEQLEHNALLYVLKHRQYELANFLVDNGADITYEISPGFSILDYFISSKDKKAVELLTLRYEQSFLGKNNFSALEKAVALNDTDIVKVLLKNIDNKSLYNVTDTFLHTAISLNNLSMVKLLIKAGANINQRDEIKNTPLFHAVKLNQYAIVEYLLSFMIDIDQECENNLTALELSISEQRFKIFLALSEKANLKRINNFGQTPLKLAIQNKNLAFIEHLALSGAIERDKKYLGYDNTLINVLQNAIYFSAGFGTPEIIQFFINYGANINSYSLEDEESPLHNAVKQKNIENVEYLISLNADVNQLSLINGESALHLAAKNGYNDIIFELLKSESLEINLTTKISDRNALDFSIFYGHDKTAQLLIEHEANVSDNYTFYPLDFFVKQRLFYSFNYLVENKKYQISPDKLYDNAKPFFLSLILQFDFLWIPLFYKQNNIDIYLKDEKGHTFLDYLNDNTLFSSFIDNNRTLSHCVMKEENKQEVLAYLMNEHVISE